MIKNVSLESCKSDLSSALSFISYMILEISHNNSESLLLLMRNRDNNSNYVLLFTENIFHV